MATERTPIPALAEASVATCGVTRSQAPIPALAEASVATCGTAGTMTPTPALAEASVATCGVIRAQAPTPALAEASVAACKVAIPKTPIPALAEASVVSVEITLFIPVVRCDPVTLGQRWNDHWDPLYRGVTPAGIANGMCLTNGFSFTRMAGGVNLHRSAGDTPDPDNAIIVGATSPTAATPTQVRNFPTYLFAAETTYSLWPRAINPGGAREERPISAVRIETDADGAPLGLVPNAPIRVAANPTAGGTIRLTWRRNPDGEETIPRSWNIRHDNGTGTMIETPLANVGGHAYKAGPYSHDATVKFQIAGLSAADLEGPRCDEFSATADTEGPEDLPAPVLSYGEET